MIKLENTQVVGWEPSIRGMRNPKNSWGRMDSEFMEVDHADVYVPCVNIGPNDHKLMMSLAKGGPVHAKYRRMLVVYVDITAPLYFWKEWDTYKVGTVANSCSTMHKIHDKEFTLEDFSCEHLKPLPQYVRNLAPNNHYEDPVWVLNQTIKCLNFYRELYIETKSKDYWWQMIQLLPSSYNQKRTVMLSYETLANIYEWRRNHKLDEWHEVCRWIESLPYSEIITQPILEKDKKVNIEDIMDAVVALGSDDPNMSEYYIAAIQDVMKMLGKMKEK